MRIVVTLKEVVDTSVPVEADPVRPAAVLEEGLVYVVNPGDRSALEAAVRLREQRGGEVTAITLGTARSEGVLRGALAAGADRALRLWDEAFTGSDARATAAILAAAIGPLNPDLVLCGRRSLDSDTGLVPPMLAELLGLPFVGGVTDLETGGEEGTATVQRALERGDREVLRCRLPAVMAVEVSLAEPRYPGLPELVAALRAPLETRDLVALGLPRRRVGAMGSLAKLLSLGLPRPRPKRIFTPDSSLSAEQRMQAILSGGVGRKQGDLLEGSPEEMAEQLVGFLGREGLL